MSLAASEMRFSVINSIALSKEGKLRNQVVFNVGYRARIAVKVATVALYVNGVYFLLE